MPNTSIINCCLAIEAIDVLSPPLKPMSFPMALARLLTQALPSWGPCSTQLSLCVQLPQLPSLLTLSYKHISAEWNPEKTLHSTESCRCVASLCYKTGHLSTVSREKSKYSHLVTVLYQYQRKKITHKTQNRRVSNQRLTHVPSGVVLSLQESLLLWVMPVDDGKQLWQGLHLTALLSHSHSTVEGWVEGNHHSYQAHRVQHKQPGDAVTSVEGLDASLESWNASCFQPVISPESQHPHWPPTHLKDWMLLFSPLLIDFREI